MSAGAALDFTGERFTPECVREIWYEHWHRYALVRAWARGRRVLDAACGEGYGSALLAQVGDSVLGLDVAPAAVAHARERYGAMANLRFDQADATRLELAPGSFDLVVSFETLEHVEAQDALLDGLGNALADDGLLVISSPDKATYSDAAGFRNEYHVRELYRDEFEALLRRRYPYVRLYAQRLLFQSAIWSVDPPGLEAPGQYLTAGADGRVDDGLTYAPHVLHRGLLAPAAARAAGGVLVRRSRRIGLSALQSRNSQEHGCRRAHRRTRGAGGSPAARAGSGHPAARRRDASAAAVVALLGRRRPVIPAKVGLPAVPRGMAAAGTG
ncbi:class I SAM-dependent methyltransferase [Tahibacter sp. UC22_41]|uniref:class I SAM-dependent methyltransferase n=1 Tax=Tahibacter sp. UC22_41 TaxID=3350178 RepID=UPI0036DD460A